MSASERIYIVLLRAYPPEFRLAYGREMLLAFRNQRRDEGHASLRFWGRMIGDLGRSAIALRLEALGARNEFVNQRRGTMKTMAILAILLGAMSALNAGIEASAAGWGGHDALGTAGIVLAVISGLLLVVAGVAMLRRAPGAAMLARVAAFMCFAVFTLILLFTPMMSIFADLIGIGFPIVLLAYLYLSGGNRQRASIA